MYAKTIHSLPHKTNTYLLYVCFVVVIYRDFYAIQLPVFFKVASYTFWHTLGTIDFCYNTINKTRQNRNNAHLKWSDVAWASRRLKSLETRIFPSLFKLISKRTSNSCIMNLLLGQSTGDPWILLKKGQWLGKNPHFLKSQWDVIYFFLDVWYKDWPRMQY